MLAYFRPRFLLLPLRHPQTLLCERETGLICAGPALSCAAPHGQVLCNALSLEGCGDVTPHSWPRRRLEATGAACPAGSGPSWFWRAKPGTRVRSAPLGGQQGKTRVDPPRAASSCVPVLHRTQSFHPVLASWVGRPRPAGLVWQPRSDHVADTRVHSQ